MAVKAIDPQLTAYYEQTRHPMPDALKDINVRSIHDRANIKYNEKLWQKVQELNQDGQIPSVSEFRRIAADVRCQVDIELYECDEPNRFSMDEIIYRVWDCQIGLSPISEPGAEAVEGDYRLAASISISTRGLSKKEATWIRNCFINHRPDDSGGDHTVALLSSIDVDTIELVDRWLPKRIRNQLLGHVRGHAENMGDAYKLPLSYRWRLFIGKIL